MRILFISTCVLILLSCNKENVNNNVDSTQSDVLRDLSLNVYLSTYENLSLRTNKFHQDVQTFINNPSEENLELCRNDWKSAREAWEVSEAWLFGPVSTKSIDPRIDTWPVDFIRLDSVLASSSVFDNTYVNNLEESLKGFHPIEYILFGFNGNKSANQITRRQKEYLLALTENLRQLTIDLHNSWAVQGDDYVTEILNAGSSNIFPSKLSAYQEIASAMIGICDEVANGKIGDVFTSLDSMGEESPFANNSMVDFKNNILGAEAVYLGNIYGNDNKGLEDFVRMHNLSLDGKIKQKINLSKAALNQITLPFGRAIFEQPIQVQQAIDAINSLKTELEEGLLPLIQLHVK
jgi:putative iron-regulated protein